MKSGNAEEFIIQDLTPFLLFCIQQEANGVTVPLDTLTGRQRYLVRCALLTSSVFDGFHHLLSAYFRNGLIQASNLYFAFSFSHLGTRDQAP